MPLTDGYLSACDTAIQNLAELTAFRTAATLADATQDEYRARWARVYELDTTGSSAASRLTQAIRSVVNAEAEKHQTNGDGIINVTERETAYQDFVATYAATIDRPDNLETEYEAFEEALKQEIMG